MQNRFHSLIPRWCAASLAAGAVWLSGCATGNVAGTSAVNVVGTRMQGTVHGGQNAVIGSTIQLYAAGSSGYGSPSTALLTTAVASDMYGNFSITDDYTCPSSSSQVYLTAVGGNPGSGTNANLSLMAALGNCGNLTPTTFVLVDELTTVAAVYALSPFMTSYTAIGTSSTNTLGLTNAFASAQKLVNTATGTAPGTAPAGAVIPTSELNTLADILAACVNTQGGSASDTSTNCGKLFSYSTPSGGTAATETIGAGLLIARNPAHSVNNLLALSSSTAPFQPTITAANDFTVSVKYASAGLITPSGAGFDGTGQLWVTNAGNSTVTRFDVTGAPTVINGGGLSAPSGIALDAGGNAWVTNKTGNSVTTITSAGSASAAGIAAGTLNSPTGIAIDGSGSLWISNSGSSQVSQIGVTGTTVTSSTSYNAGGINAPIAIAVNPE
jgi:hypothetical protein